jgi:HlyD family secretion protein
MTSETASRNKTRTRTGILGLAAWQWGVIALLLAGGGAGGYFGLGRLLGDDPASANSLLYPVTRGDIAQTVSTNGSVAYSTRETLNFSAAGTVGDVFVAEGQAVEKDAPIATLDDGTVASLQRAVREAEIALRTAEENAAALKVAASTLEVAEARAALANAASALRDVEGLTKASLLKAVADARIALSAAQDKVQKLSSPSAAGIAAAQSEVSAARASVRAAEESLATLGNGAAQADAASDVLSAETALANAASDLRVAEQVRADKVDAAKDALDTAEDDYAGAVSAWTGVKVLSDDLQVPPGRLLDSWGTDYDGLLASVDSGEATMSDDPGTPWNEQVLFLWTRLLPAQVQGSCTAQVSAGVRCIQAELESAWSKLGTARNAYDTTISQQTAAVNNATSAHAKAEDALKAARQAAADIESGEARALRSATAAAANSRLADAESALARALVVDEAALVQAQAQQADAEARLASAEADLEEIDAGVAEAIALAKGRQEAAQEKLDDLLEVGKDALKVSLAEAQVQEAKSRLANARAVLAGATIYAPFAGVVSSMAVEPGQNVNAATAVAEVIDPAVMEVDATVDEIDVLSLRVGATATITMDALGGRGLTGTVAEIGAAANSQNGVVSYPISVRIDNSQGIQLREGLSATASVMVRSETDAMLIPVQAVGGSLVRPTVKVLRGGAEQNVEVELGISDDSFVAVRRGLAEGDQVYVETGTGSAAADARLQRLGAIGQRQGFLGGQGAGGPQIFIGPGGATEVQIVPGQGAGQGGRRQQGPGGN